METFIIWFITIIFILLIFVPAFLKYRRNLKKAQKQQEEALRLGANKPIAQHPVIDPFTCIGCGACVDACPEGDVLAVVSGKAVIINGSRCVGHGKCAEACPVEGITIGLGDISKRDDIPLLSEQYETTIPGIYIVGELGGLALIRNATKQGKQAVVHIATNGKRSSVSEILDVVIIGAGPAGFSAGAAAKEQNLSYVVLDQQEAGGTILQYPRKKIVMTGPVELPLYGKLTKAEYSKEELLAIWKEVESRFDLNIKTNEKLQNISNKNTVFEIETNSGHYQALHVILALGRRGTPRKLNVKGEDKAKVMYKLLDAESYQNEHLLIVGGGDSAIEAAIGLAGQPGSTVTISYRKEKFFRLKRRNEERINELIRSGVVTAFFNSTLLEISDTSVRLNSEQKEIELQNDYTFIFAGGEPPFDLLKKIGIQFGSSSI